MNSLSASIKEQWSMDYQDVAEKANVFSNFCNFRYESDLRVGDTVHRPYISDVEVNTLGSEGQYTRQNISSTDETLVIDTEKEASFYIKKIDEFQSHYPTREKFARQCGVKLMNHVDGVILGEVVNSDSYVDAGDVGGSAGSPITLTTSNVDKVFTAVGRKLEQLDNDLSERRFGNIIPYFKQILLDSLAGRETALGDSTGINGHCGSRFDFELFQTNAAYWVGVLGLATNPTADDTITINGVTFTFKATPAAAGQIDIGADVDATRVLLAAAINNTNGYAAGAGSATAYFEVSEADRKKLKDMVATDSPSANTLTLVAYGRGYVAVDETLTAAGDVFSSEVAHLLFGQGRPVDAVIQKSPEVMLKDRDGYIGKDVVNYLVFGKKTFRDGKRRMVDVRINTAVI